MEQWEADLAVTKMQNKKFREDNSNNFIQPDEQSALRLRVATINNSKVTTAGPKDPLDMTQVLNQNAGTVSISYTGGVSATGPMGGTAVQTSEYVKNNNAYNFKDRKFNYVTTSTDANTKLASPYIWTGQNADGQDTWCGFNYVPLQNSLAILGNKESGQPLILNYIPSNPSVLLPALKPGEIAISGYGHNYIHWGQSDKITIHCDSISGKVDYDDPNYLSAEKTPLKKNAADCDIDIVINSNDRMILIKTSENGTMNNTYSEYNSDTRPPNGYQYTKIIISPTDVDIITNGDKDNDGAGTTHVNINNEGIVTDVSSGNRQTVIEQTEAKVNVKYINDDNNLIITQNIEDDTITQNIMQNDISNANTMTVDSIHTLLTTENYTTEEKIEENYIYRKIQDLNDELKYTEEKIDSENYFMHTKDYKVEAENISMKTESMENDVEINADTYTVNANEINLNSADVINISTPRGTHEGSGSTHEEEYTEGKRAGQKKKFKIKIDGCEVKIDADESHHGEIL